ncbi:MAG: M50 family metallopeptidase [Christensenellales bacterium]
MDLLVTIISTIGALIIISIIIIVHELGHFLIGRACKIKIMEFSVGFGPKIKQWVKNDTTYSVRWILLGGYNRFYGEDQEVADKLAFNKQPAGRRALTIAAGSVFNILFALLLVIIMLWAFGDYVPKISEVWGEPGREAGLKPDDIILSMNGVKTDNSLEYNAALRASDNVTMDITVLRGKEELSFNVPYQYYENYNYISNNQEFAVTGYKTGISITGEQVNYGFFDAVAMSFRWMFLLIRETLVSLFGAVSGRATEGISGIVGVVGIISKALRISLEWVLQLGVTISVSIAVINLLPLPALDGGRLVFIGIEKIFKKPVPRNVEGVIHLIGFALLVMLFFVITYKDIFGG